MKTIAALALFSVAGSASAAVFVQNDTFSSSLPPGTDSANFLAFQSIPGWQPTWTLQSVELIFDVTIGADVTAENDSIEPAPGFGLEINGSATVDIESLFGFAAIGSVAASGPLGGSDGTAGSGPDFNDFGSVSDTYNGGDFVASPVGVAPFDFAGSVTATLNAGASFGFVGTSNATLQVQNLAATGNVTLIYNYIPAPGAAALFGIAGMTAARRRR